MPLNTDFFQDNAINVAEDLIGSRLIHDDGTLLQGRIVETEAYLGDDDPASHASDGETSRNSVMFGPAGRSYVYICYGIHHMFNIVTGEDGDPQAVLIRAVEPLHGLDEMQTRRDISDSQQLCNGPGKLCEAFGIDRQHSDIDLTSGHLRIEDGDGGLVGRTPRIGVSGGEDLDYRFIEKGSSFVSRH